MYRAWTTQEDHRRLGGELGADADQQGQGPEPAHRREGQEALEVGLAVGEHRADDEGEGPGDHDDVVPGVGAAQGGVQPGQEVDPGLHHRGRVEVRAHRARRRHGPGQPEVERELRGLGEGPGEDQEQDRQVERVGLDRARLGLEGRQLGRPRDLAEEEEPGQERQAAAAGDEQRLEGRGPGLLLLVVEADEDVGADAGELPEHEEADGVVGQDQAEHGAHEEEEGGVEAGEPGVALEVAPGVDEDQRADAGDQEREQQRQAVEAEGEPDPEVLDPGPRLRPGVATGDVVEPGQEPPEQCRRDHREDGPRALAQHALQAGGHRRQGEEDEDRGQHGMGRNRAEGQTNTGGRALLARDRRRAVPPLAGSSA